jgi:hypothetical protein
MDLYLDNIIDHGQNPRNFGAPLHDQPGVRVDAR